MFTSKFGRILTLVIAFSLLTSLFVLAEAPFPVVSDGPSDEAAALPVASHRLIVELESPPLALWYKTVSRAQATAGRLDVDSPTAQNYIAQLETEQAAFVQAMAVALPDAAVATYINENGEPAAASYQVVMNAVTVDPGTADVEAAMRALRKVAGVKNVYRDYMQKPAMYASIPLIDAPAMWAQLGGQDASGEGIIVASIDTGVYVPNPFFDPTGYSYPPGYPVGNSEYTTEKVIGARAYFRPWDPPTPGDETPWPGPNGSSHGTHTIGTAAGNADTVAEVAGLEYTISGVAPKAQILSYRIGYPTSSEYSGSAFDAEIVMAYEDAVMDGADVINYSFGGYSGVMPWASATAMARDAAWDAGVFVSHSAGNEGPGSSTTTDFSPKVIEVAASSTTGTIAAGRFKVTAPEPVPPALMDIPYAAASFGAALPLGQIVGPFDFVTSDSVDPANFEGCNPWPAGTFTGKAAVISRGVCEFGLKVLNAEQAGAEFVVIRNHAAGGEGLVNMGPGVVGGQVTISSIFVGYTNGLALVDWYNSHGAASQFAVDTIAFQLGNVPDVIASFSSRGPAGARFLEPDVTAPGVNILSAGYAVGATGVDQHMGFGQAGGTSMAAPHVAGSAALLKQMHPTWTNDQIMSALKSTAVTEVWLDAAKTIPAGVLDMGAGRIDLGEAGDPGLTFMPSSLSFGPHKAGATKTITVMATDVSSAGGTYALKTEADAGIVTWVSPTRLTFAAGETKSFRVTVDTTGADAGDYGGMVWLDDGTHMSHLPLWVRVEEPMAEADVLLIDNDMSDLLGYPDYTYYYTSTLEALGVTYDYYNADLHFNNPQTLPSAAELAAYDVIIYWSGDNYQPNGTFTVATPLTLLDMQTLTDWQYGGGRLLVTGQDLASAWDALDSSGDGYFIYSGNLGTKYLQDSLFDPGYAGLLPPMPSVVGVPGSPLGGLVLDLSDSGDGAANQYYVDEVEVAPYGDTAAPETIKPILAAIDGAAVMEGYVASSRADGPTLEEPEPAFDYRSLYLSFGFEGINDDSGYNTREDLMGALYNWLTDEVSVSLAPVEGKPMELLTFNATFDSSVGADAVQYRWDFGDGSDIAVSGGPSVVHSYDVGGKYLARVEVTDAYGHTAISEPILVDLVTRTYLPLILKAYTHTPPTPAEITILHTNDFHGNLETDYRGRGGSAYMAGVIEGVRAEVGEENVFLLDAGDVFFGGPPISQLLMGESTIDVYNMLGYDVANFGNHEFDKGQDVLQDRIAQSDFPWIGANIVVDGTDWTHPDWVKPYVILSKDGVDLGIIGVDTDETPLVTLKGTTDGLVFKDLTATVLHYYDEVMAKSDALIVLAHMGTDDSGAFKGLKTVAQELIDAGKPVDLMIAGHQHQALSAPVMVGDTAIIGAGYYGRWLGRADVIIDPATKSLTLDDYELITISSSLPADPAVAAQVQDWADIVAPLVEQVVGHTNVDLVRDYNNESIMGDLVADSMLWKADEYDDGAFNGSVDIAFTNPGGLRADITIPMGATLPYTVTWGDTFNVLPFANTLYLMDLTGAQVQELLDQAASLYKGILQTSGASWTWYNDCDCDAPTVWGAYDVKVGGQPLDPDASYRVVTNNFLAPGGDGWVTFNEGTNRWDTYYDMQEALNEYISTITPIDAADIPMDRIIKLDKLVTILHTNDTHGTWPEAYYYGDPEGFAFLASHIKAERAKNPNVLLLDAGDTFQGNAFAQYFRNATPNPIAGGLNLLGYDAFTIGNHEFNFGPTTFATMLGQLSMPILGTINLDDDGNYGFINDHVDDYINLDVDGVKVTVFGLTNPRVYRYELPTNIPGLTFYSGLEKGFEAVPAILAAEEPDVLVGLTHMGYSPYGDEIDSDKLLAEGVAGIDVIIGGHSHTVLDPAVMVTSVPTNTEGTLIAQTGRYAMNLGKVNIGLVDDGAGGYDVVMREGYLLSAEDVSLDPDMVNYLAPFEAELDAYTSTEIGQTTVPIDALQAYTQETNGANLQADAAIYELESNGITVDLHLSGAMSNRKVADGATPASPVTLTVDDMYTLMPYENSLLVLSMNGPQIKEVLERGYRNWWWYNQGSPWGGYSHYTTCLLDTDAGNVITYSGDLSTEPDGNNVVSLTIDGVPVDFADAATYYNVSTVNYLAAGSCNFNNAGVTIWPLNQIVADTQYYVRDSVIDYIAAQPGPISPAIEGRLVFPVP